MTFFTRIVGMVRGSIDSLGEADRATWFPFVFPLIPAQLVEPIIADVAELMKLVLECLYICKRSVKRLQVRLDRWPKSLSGKKGHAPRFGCCRVAKCNIGKVYLETFWTAVNPLGGAAHARRGICIAAPVRDRHLQSFSAAFAFLPPLPPVSTFLAGFQCDGCRGVGWSQGRYGYRRGGSVLHLVAPQSPGTSPQAHWSMSLIFHERASFFSMLLAHIIIEGIVIREVEVPGCAPFYEREEKTSSEKVLKWLKPDSSGTHVSYNYNRFLLIRRIIHACLFDQWADRKGWFFREVTFQSDLSSSARFHRPMALCRENFFFLVCLFLQAGPTGSCLQHPGVSACTWWKVSRWTKGAYTYSTCELPFKLFR